ncbi:MAG: hypothetical protein M0Z90_05935 [Desulfobacteraceae bacterium]|nr:hypothetical protein [Desulfobacteraceae bacterium]
MKKPKTAGRHENKKGQALQSERAMIAGIMEGSPEAIGVAVVRLDCGCRKMAAVDKNGDPASKVIIYRDGAESVCEQCQADNGAWLRVTCAFIDWEESASGPEERAAIELKVLGPCPVPQ